MRRSRADSTSFSGFADHGGQKSMRELSAYSRPDLRHFLGGAEPIKPRHQRGVQTCGHCQRRDGHGGGGLSRLAFAFRLQDCPRHFFNKEGNAVRPLDNVLPNVLRKRHIACKTVDNGSGFAVRRAD